jgi:hemerythrin superfamily protein
MWDGRWLQPGVSEVHPMMLGETMDALKLLKHDHETVKKLLSELDKTTEEQSDKREELFAQVKRELTIHETIEEEILYPTFEEKAKLKEIVLEGYQEHHVVDLVLGEMMEIDADDESWGAKLSVAKENVEHHIEEEEGEMFKKARQVFDEKELEELGVQLEMRKKELEGQSDEELEESRDAA